MSAHCPPQEQLERLLDDRLETIEDSAVAQHVESCAQCQDRLEQLLSGSLSSRGSAQTNPEMSDALLNRLKKRGRRDDETDEFKGEQPLANGAAALPDVPGYEVLSEIGRGGMGVIYKARHLRLGRVVALKMILARAHARSDELRRFRIEASAVARLAHPGIVGVYDVGEHEGLPYLSLELVEGGSLKQLLAGTPQPPRESARLVEQLARAVQHAHDAGIVHRDLKPANVLLTVGEGGRRGVSPPVEDALDRRAYAAPLAHLIPKVTDFGLAKLLTESPSDGPTQSGAVVGTPGYMAPEQAAGNQRQVGPAADVYALGAILYECLTGRPPFQAPTTLETLLQVMHEEPVSISRLQPQVPRDLATIAMRCLEKQPVKRYVSARDLADDLGRFLAGRPILARRVRPCERGWRWCKRNPVVAGLASSLLMALVVGIAGVSWKWWEADQRRQQAEVSAEAEKQARQSEADQRARAEKASDRTRQVLDAMVSGVTGESLSTQKAITEEQKKFLSGVLSYYREFAGEKADDEKTRARTASAGYQVGLIEYRLGRTEEGVAAFRMARDDYEKLTADFPAVADYRRYLALSHTNLGKLLADLGKRAEAEQQYQKGLAIFEKLAVDLPAGPDYRRDLAQSHTNLGTVLTDLGRRAEAQEQYQKGLALWENLAADFPAVPDHRRDLALSHTNLGALLADLGKGVEAQEQYQKALAIQEKLAADFPAGPDYRRYLALSHNNLGALLANLGKRAEAREQVKKGLAIREKLAADYPAVPDYRQALAQSHNKLGRMLADLGERAEAQEQLKKGLAIQEKLAADFPAVPDYRSELADCHNNLGRLLAGLGKRAEAQVQDQSALAIREKLAADFPAVPAYRRYLAISHNNLGNLLAALGKRAEAQVQVNKGLAIREKLAADFPAVPDYRQELGQSHNNLGRLLQDLGERAEALEQYQSALAIFEKLAADFPAMPDHRRALAASHNNLGALLAGLGKRAQGLEQVKKGLAIQEKLAADFPAVPVYQLDLSGSYCNLGNLMCVVGRPADSLAWFQKAIATLQPVHEKEPRDVTARQFLRNSHLGRAVVHGRLGNYADAVQDWDRAVELSDKAEQPGFRAFRATSKLQAGQVAEAVAEVAELTKSPRWNAGQWYDFACVYAVASGKVEDKKQPYADRAMALLHQAVKAGYKDAAHMKADTDLDALRERDDFKKLLAELAK